MHKGKVCLPVQDITTQEDAVIHASTGIRACDPSVRVVRDSGLLTLKPYPSLEFHLDASNTVLSSSVHCV